jgi:NTP pyrophosphatase (non-canonical NTP hydrolase)
MGRISFGKGQDSMLTDLQTDEILLETMSFYGYEKQAMIAVEELSELTKAFCKLARYGVTEKTRASVKEEMADAMIMILQFKAFLDMPDSELSEEIRRKVSERLKDGLLKSRTSTVSGMPICAPACQPETHPSF